MTQVDPVVIRNFNPAVKGEQEFLLSTWLRDLHDADPSGLPDELWFGAHRQYIRDLLADPEIVVLVAAASDEPTEILGYVVARPREVLEWIHVKRPLRGRGLARRLLEAALCPPGTPARWRTPLARDRLRNPCRGRQLRRASGSPRTPTPAR